MIDKIDDFLDSKGKKLKSGFTEDQKKDMKWITENVIHPTLKTFKDKFDKRENMSADLINSKKDAKDTFEIFEIRIKENHSNKFSYSVIFTISDNGELTVNRQFSNADIYGEFSSPTIEKFNLSKATDIIEDVIKDDILEKLKDII